MGYIMSNLGTLSDYLGIFENLLAECKKIIEGTKEKNTAKIRQAMDSVAQLWEKEDVDYLQQDIKDLVWESQEGSKRVSEIVKSLKSFSRMDAKTVKENNINDGIEDTLKVVWNELKYKCTVHKELGEIPLIQCSLGQLNQVFMNLLVNAAHAIEDHGDIGIKTYVEGEYLVVEISDTGKGISEENKRKIFEPFFTTKSVGKGTGLGLAISHSIIEEHKGKIDLQSEVGKGTTFKISLPINSEE
jgi:signal transduction histidine kinase